MSDVWKCKGGERKESEMTINVFGEVKEWRGKKDI